MTNLDYSLGNVWARSGGAANGAVDARRLGWMTLEQRRRAERLRQARLLFEGRHKEYFLDESRTAFAFPPLKSDRREFFRPYNLLTLVAEKMADLLFGEAPRVYVDDATAQPVLDAIAERSWLDAMLIDVAAECCWAGEAFLEITLQPGEAGPAQAYIGTIPADEIWPVGLPGPDRQHARYVRYSTATIEDAPGKARTLLLEVHYTAGLIGRAVYQLEQVDASGPQRSRRLAMDQWPGRDAAGLPLAEQQSTGMPRCNIIRVPNGFGGVSDYDGLIELQDALHAANTQIGRVIAKHADPKLAAPDQSADGEGKLSNAEVFFFRSKDEIPQYITWNAELEAAMEDRRFALSSLATASEIPLSLLGVKDDSSVESARKMRLAASTALAKSQRKAVVWRSAMRMALELAFHAERGFAPGKAIGIEMRDGLPDDELDRANVIATLRGAGAMSRKRSLQQQWLDAASVADELGEIEAEAKAAMPAVIFGESGEGSGGESDAATERRSDEG
jgi:hypothetical protein